ncbi:MAG: ABC transporter permease subunit [Clostridiales bacterium]|nr:ABC transporter permease subunit [Clostridiales bacterium]
MANKQTARSSLWKRIVRNKWVYMLFLPAFLYFVIFAFVPFYWIQIAFKDFKIFLGVNASEWVGLKHFKTIFADPMTGRLIFNTLRISLANIVFGFPVPIIFALLLNEVVGRRYKRLVQTVSYFPHFLSWVVYAGVVFAIVGPKGALNSLISLLGGKPASFITDPGLFIPVIVVSGILKGFGWGAIIYLAGISGIDPILYEAACIDGAGRWKQMWHVTLPGIRPFIGLNLCMAVAGILNASFDQVFMFLNNSNKTVGEVISTYVYKMGMLSNKYEYSTAVGLLQGVVSTLLLVSANALSKRLGEKSLW